MQYVEALMFSVMYTMYHVVPYCHHEVAEICHLSFTVSSISLYLAYKLRKKVSEKIGVNHKLSGKSYSYDTAKNGCLTVLKEPQPDSRTKS